MRRRAVNLILMLFAASVSVVHAQSPAAPHIESVQELVARLTPEQKQKLEDAGKASAAQRYADALTAYKLLLNEFPADPVLSKFAGEAALNNGNTAFAVNTLKSIAPTGSDDWQAVALLTRACAESGDKTCRDTGIAQMIDLHKRGLTPPRMQQYIVERVKAGTKNVLIFTSLEPWGPYSIQNYAQFFDEAGRLYLRATVESGDFDQPGFAKEHPAEAAAGVRSFSLDGYQDTGTNANGQRMQTHSTFQFFIGQPTYDTVRQAFLNIASGQAHPISNRTNLPVQ